MILLSNEIPGSFLLYQSHWHGYIVVNQTFDGLKPKIIIIVGPTASGKSDLAASLAESVNGEVVNADSMQVYRGMAIGTARPSADLMQRVPHHLFAVVDPDVNFTAADFVASARRVIADIYSRGGVPIIVGGTGLYVRALLHGLAESPAADEEYRRHLAACAEENGAGALHGMLARVDPDAASRLHVNDRLRIIRALEVYHRTGRPMSAFQADHGFAHEYYQALQIGLSVDRDLIYRRIEERVDAMIAAGLIDEVSLLLSRGYSPQLKSMGAIGYKEICDYLAGRVTLAEAVELVKRNTRRYAKRQLTWFRRDREIKWLEYPESFDNIKRIVCDFINRRSV